MDKVKTRKLVSQQIKIINKEIEIIKKNQVDTVELKSPVTKIKN